MKRIGIIGKGFVGSAVAHGFSEATGYQAKIRIFDKDPLKATHSLKELVNFTEIVFISVPTPSYKDGSINLNILSDCLDEINHVASQLDNFNAVYLI